MGTLARVPRICGREAEIEALGEALDRVAAGAPAVVLVEGEAGIGKSRLLAEVLGDAAGRGMRVAAGEAEELERTRPFGMLTAAFGCTRSSPDSLRAAIAGLLAAPGAGDLGPITVTSDPGLRFRVVDAFTDLVEELALAGAVVLGLDDLPAADVLETLSDCCDRYARCGLALEYPVIGPDLVRLALAAGEAGRARDVAAAVTDVASENEVPWITGAALRCQGLAENDADILQAAVDAYARGPRPHEFALACEDAGAAFAQRGDVARGGQLLDQAITIYERLDAARGLARAEATLRQMGVRRGRHVMHRRAQSGWQSLTPSERAVVDLVAEGLPNPQIGQRLYVSRRTVQTHLAHVFAKLHITSRAQLAAEAARHRG